MGLTGDLDRLRGRDLVFVASTNGVDFGFLDFGGIYVYNTYTYIMTYRHSSW